MLKDIPEDDAPMLFVLSRERDGWRQKWHCVEADGTLSLALLRSECEALARGAEVDAKFFTTDAELSQYLKGQHNG